MIVLDTNVISEIMLPMPDLKVLTWLDCRPSSSIWTTSVNIFEIRSGLQSMPQGKRRSTLMEWFERWLAEVIQGRVASFDEAAARRAADLTAFRKEVGRTGETRDTMIAGIVLASHASLATRNVKHFEDIASSVVNPWEA
ncbi:MAG: type II toxin-antitoxin system VapC family toxin [Terracidiphilus sp.]|jgi:predicted nucleic acid-binding protein